MPRQESGELAVSVIVPVFNVPQKLIERCIRSIVDQQDVECEILLIDDGSESECARFCDAVEEAFDSVAVVHQANAGVSSARNAGIDRARGRYCAFVDPDDELCDSLCLYNAVRIADETEADLVAGRVEYQFVSKAFSSSYGFDGSWRLFEAQSGIKDFPEFFLSFFSQKNSAIPPSLNRGPAAKLVRSSILKNVRFNTSFSYAEDGVFFSEVSEMASKIVLVDQVWYRYYQYKSSASHAKPFSICRRQCRACADLFQGEAKKKEVTAFSAHCILDTCVSRVQGKGFSAIAELRRFFAEEWVAAILDSFDETSYEIPAWKLYVLKAARSGNASALFFLVYMGNKVLWLKGKRPIG